MLSHHPDPDQHPTSKMSYYEVEHFIHESDLHDKMEFCTKNPGHTKFISVADIYLPQHLPPRYHNTLWIDYINAIIHLTVRMTVNYTSWDRPKRLPGSDMKGKKWRRVGSGRVTRVVRKFADKDGGKCPCEECRKCPDQARTQWAKFDILTAHHVVYDDEECRHTKCDVGYDRDEDLGKCPKLEGVEVPRSDESKDLCMIYCVTHDENTCNKLEEWVSRFYDIRRKLHDICKRSQSGGDMSKVPVICVSHPHGLSKHISVGEWSGRKDKNEPHKWAYTTDTCCGSSGAPVFMLGCYGLSCTNLSTHSGWKRHGESECGWEGWCL